MSYPKRSRTTPNASAVVQPTAPQVIDMELYQQMHAALHSHANKLPMLGPLYLRDFKFSYPPPNFPNTLPNNFFGNLRNSFGISNQIRRFGTSGHTFDHISTSLNQKVWVWNEAAHDYNAVIDWPDVKGDSIRYPGYGFVPKRSNSYYVSERDSINYERQPLALDTVRNHLQQSGYGDLKTNTTKYDEKVRFAFESRDFVIATEKPDVNKRHGPSMQINDPMLRRSVETITESMSVMFQCPVRLELQKLNAYPVGGHFKEHVDTPTDPTVIGSFVLVLPTPFEGGEFTVGGSQNRNARQGAWAMKGHLNLRGFVFNSDTPHAVAPVTRGVRTTLAFAVHRMEHTDDAVPATTARPRAKVKKVLCELQSKTGITELAVLLENKYPRSALALAEPPLKGNDCRILALLRDMFPGTAVNAMPVVVKCSSSTNDDGTTWTYETYVYRCTQDDLVGLVSPRASSDEAEPTPRIDDGLSEHDEGDEDPADDEDASAASKGESVQSNKGVEINYTTLVVGTLVSPTVRGFPIHHVYSDYAEQCGNEARPGSLDCIYATAALIVQLPANLAAETGDVVSDQCEESGGEDNEDATMEVEFSGYKEHAAPIE